ncbi:MAG: MerR family transcriptional regulator, partial [Traorella sp.]
MYTIKQASEMLNIPASTLRYYEEEQILPPLKRSSGNQRLFDDQDIIILKIIICLKKTKMPIPEMRKFIELYAQGPSTIPQRKELFQKHRERILNQ